MLLILGDWRGTLNSDRFCPLAAPGTEDITRTEPARGWRVAHMVYCGAKWMDDGGPDERMTPKVRRRTRRSLDCLLEGDTQTRCRLTSDGRSGETSWIPAIVGPSATLPKIMSRNMVDTLAHKLPTSQAMLLGAVAHKSKFHGPASQSSLKAVSRSLKGRQMSCSEGKSAYGAERFNCDRRRRGEAIPREHINIPPGNVVSPREAGWRPC
jgi:hypothetical protein